MPPKVAASLQVLIFLLLVAAALFASAGRFDIPGFWLYLAVLTVICLAALLLVDPDLAQERIRPGGRRLEALYVLALLWPLAHWSVAGLDCGRFHWSDTVPRWLQLMALVLFAASWSLAVWAAQVNRFASSVVRIQEERGHHVVTTGPYALMRHPTYLAGVVLFLLSGVALGSWLAVAVAAPGVPMLLWRTIREDRFLHANLPGYREYSEQVRYRLIPGFW
jgi:protein-S-isoprenylcysteine O-methyltransferase Ste14